MSTQLLNIKAAAARIGISRASLYLLLKGGAGPATVKIGRRRLVAEDTLSTWIKEREEIGLDCPS